MRTETQSISAAGVGEDNGSFLANCREWLCSIVDKIQGSIVGFAGKLAKIARDDPRRLAHAFKVGLALNLVSIVYYVSPLFNGFGNSAMWAVLTVVVVMEFTVGGTLSKGLNRAFATLLAGLLAVVAHLVADQCGGKGEPILLGVFVFVVASAVTFSRFIPEVKARYDYGVTIFILTFSLVAVSSYRVQELIELAHQRFTTILVGVGVCLFTSIFIFPIWAGEDLHSLAVNNFDKLAEFLEGMESECFSENASSGDLVGKSFLQVYKSVLDSKVREDSLCPEVNPERCLKVRVACREMSSNSAKVLRELAKAIRTMTMPSPTNNSNMSAAIEAAKGFTSDLSEDTTLLEVMHVAVVASLLSDMVMRIKTITESVDNLAQLARFRKTQKIRNNVVIDIDCG
ncbi:hypothetical protein PR202_gb15711 [Eleusine coracana subsp. coracana]|uniref:Uncharacterized protein n=1 Tax=Eleusine coracana subsp. coracana TaxID=191504 RepID=A0AAV5EWC8_ELECO|nr:hypothetical protein QOZ80_4BG0349520 [Eleusine coracana subsp. coracana]GJN27669.1 hypothetical protein PR202_gb15711 [Eleusine coracana subsp. coracana]